MTDFAYDGPNVYITDFAYDGVFRPARGGRSCERFGGCKTINRIPNSGVVGIKSFQECFSSL